MNLHGKTIDGWKGRFWKDSDSESEGPVLLAKFTWEERERQRMGRPPHA
jgi:hypothetical protein